MSKIKYDPSVDQFRGKINGSCFQSNSQLPTLRGNPRMRQFRTNPQTYSQMLTGYFVRIWRSLDPAVQLAWNDFATTFPQRTKNSASSYLTGFQLFVKRHYYLNEFCNSDLSIMLSPLMISYPEDFLTIGIQVSNSKIYLVLTFVNADSVLDCHISVSNHQSPGQFFKGSQTRFTIHTSNFNQSIDITEQYLSLFGRLPLPGDKLFTDSLLCGSDNGQFWPHFQSIIIVTPYVAPPIHVIYGALYNSYAITSSLGLASSGAHIITRNELFSILSKANGSPLPNPSYNAALAYATRETTNAHWLNNSGTDAIHFQMRGSGFRESSNGQFSGLKSDAILACNTFAHDPYLASCCRWLYSIKYLALTAQNGYGSVIANNGAYSTKVVKDSTALTVEGSHGRYVGNDGKVYETTLIAGFEITTFNLCETKMRDGSYLRGYDGGIYTPISNAGFIALTSPAMCVFNNDLANFFTP